MSSHVAVGKDTKLALDRVVPAGVWVIQLLTLHDDASARVCFIAVPVPSMEAQAEGAGLSTLLCPTMPTTCEAAFLAALRRYVCRGYAA